jgi:hypothetical protein
LRAEAYVASQLEEQLDDQGRSFLRDPSKNRADSAHNRLYLSPIFKWFDEDFEAKSGSVQRFVLPYMSTPHRQALQVGRWSVRYTDYDWSLNDISTPANAR